MAPSIGSSPAGDAAAARVPPRAAAAASAPPRTAELAVGALAMAGPGTSDPLVGDLRRSGLVTLLVLHYVSVKPCYGNQLIDRIVALTAGAVAVNPNTMYPLLRSLEARGLVAGAWEHPERRSRRFYRITTAGRAERRRLAKQLAPNLDAIAATVEVIRRELLHR